MGYQIKNVSCNYVGYENQLLTLNISYKINVEQTILNKDYSIRSNPYVEQVVLPSTKVISKGEFDTCVLSLRVQTLQN